MNDLPLVSVIVPTIGRPDSLRHLLHSLVIQTYRSIDVVVADGSSTDETEVITDDPSWQQAGLAVTRICVSPPNAVRQRVAAIAHSSGDLLLLLDDDIVLESGCVEAMVRLLRNHATVVGVFADFNNQTWPMPTRAWSLYLRYVLGMKHGEWQGRVVGPLLRFAYNPVPKEPLPIEWLGTGSTMIRRAAYERSGGFSSFFLHRCTMNEDVDLGLKLAKVGKILFCPSARMGHFHAPGGRVRPSLVAEDDLFNRFLVIHRTIGKSKMQSLRLALLFFSVETLCNIYWSMRRFDIRIVLVPLLGRTRALFRIIPVLFGKVQFQ